MSLVQDDDNDELSASMTKLNIQDDTEKTVRKSERQIKLTEKARENAILQLEKQKQKLIRKVERKKKVIEDLLYSAENELLVKDELKLLNDLFTMLEDIAKNELVIDEEDEWFEAEEEAVCEFKRKIHGWLKSCKPKEDDVRSRRSSRKSSSCHSSRSSRSQRIIEEKKQLRELEASATFLQQKAEMKVAAEKLEMEEQLARLRARVNVDNEENKKQQTLEELLNIGEQKHTVVESNNTQKDSKLTAFNDETKDVVHKIKSEAKVSEEKGQQLVKDDFLSKWEELKNQNDLFYKQNVPSKSGPEDKPINSNDQLQKSFEFKGAIPKQSYSSKDRDASKETLNPFEKGVHFDLHAFGKTSKKTDGHQNYDQFALKKDNANTSFPAFYFGDPIKTSADEKSKVAEKPQEEKTFKNEQRNETTNYLCELLRIQSAPDIKIETFKGNPIDFEYFLAIFHEVVEKRIGDQLGRMTRLLQYTEGEPRELIKHLLQGSREACYDRAIALLKRQYGDPIRIMAAYKDEVTKIQDVRANDPEALRSLFIFLSKINSINLGMQRNPLDCSDTICRVLSKLPFHLQDRFSRNVHSMRKQQQREPMLKDLISLIEDEMTMTNDPLFSRKAVGKYKQRSDRRQQGNKEAIKSYRCDVTSHEKVNNNKRCPVCNETSHSIEYCKDYLKLDVSERSKKIFKCRLCFRCLKPVSSSHTASSCRSPLNCKVCNKGHPTTLHNSRRYSEEKKEPTDTESPTSEDSVEKKAMATTKSSEDTISICIVPVEITHADTNKIISSYAMLDSCSQGSFVTTEVAEELSIKGRKTTLSVQTVNGEKHSRTSVIKDIKVRRSGKNGDWLTIAKSYTQAEIPVNEKDTASYKQVQKWNYLKEIANEIKVDGKIEVGLLIGADCPRALEPTKVIQSQNGGPYAIESRLGWCIVGPVVSNQQSNGKHVCTYRTTCAEQNNHVEFAQRFKECDAKELIINMYNEEFAEKLYHSSNDRALSSDDKRFLNIVESNTALVDGKYQVPLPFKTDDVYLENNRKQAYKRFLNLERKFEKNINFKTLYFDAMLDMLNKGYAEKSKVYPSGRNWYIPHHGVTHPAKPNKVRIVFDASAEYQGNCINRELLKGPDLTNQLIGVLIRFREEIVCITADIEGMFFQVKLPPDQRSFFQFLWYKDNDPKLGIADYQMTSHVFGGTSSPSCSNFALRKTSLDNQEYHSKTATDALLHNFYVDDLLKSLPTENEAKQFVKDVKDLCARGGFNLTKFSSNKPSTLSMLTEKDINCKNVETDLPSAPEQSTLGLKWNSRDDVLRFKMNTEVKPTTRRGILSTISSIYDPLGLIGPYVLEGRKILQRLTKLKMLWDEKIPDEIESDWLCWRDSLSDIEKIQLKRCLKPAHFAVVREASLHIFSDASDAGYGIACYLRFINSDDEVHCSLLYGRSRVNPVKFVSIPRMELSAALLAARTGPMLLKELNTKINEVKYYTDSQVVLGYLHNESRNFKVFVANRVQQIQELTAVKDWNYVPSKDNPADHASRGITCKHHQKSLQWFNGPHFLYDRQVIHKDQKFEVDSFDEELKPKVSVNLTSTSTSLFSTLVSKVGDWRRMVRIVAVLKLFIRHACSKIRSNGDPVKLEEFETALDVNALKDATEAIIRLLHRDVFHSEIKQISDEKTLSKTSSLYSLKPILVNDVLRVGGRLSNSTLSCQLKHPIILPKCHRLTELIIQHYHQMCAHGGRNSTVNKIRQSGYWIISCSSRVKKVISKCVICRKLFGRCEQPIMGDLPEDRTRTDPPFTHVGIDAFGPMFIRERRSTLKRYGIIFTCLSLRSIHIEIVHSLSTDSFILSLRRFIGRRGNVSTIRSDNGSNFLGADIEISKAFKEMDHCKIKEYLLTKNTDWIVWKRNPPYASHMGGVWERQIRSIRRILSVLMNNHKEILNEESLHTLMVEVEMMVNSRPLTVQGIDDESTLPLSPFNILTMKEDVIKSFPGVFLPPEQYSRKQWRRVQCLAEQFWKRWQQEYLSLLQERKKWASPTRNLQIDDIVLVKEESPRNKWPMGRITAVYPGNDGVVRSVLLRVYRQDDDNRREEITRPVTKLVLLVESDSPSEEPCLVQNGAF